MSTSKDLLKIPKEKDIRNQAVRKENYQNRFMMW